jgi:hypothetical protein
MSDRELKDIGITRGEIDYAALNHSIDPRGIRSAGWMSDARIGWWIAGGN